MAIQEALRWFRSTGFRSLVVHSDSTSAIARAGHTGAGPGQAQATRIHAWISELLTIGQTVNLVWVKRHSGVPGDEEADKRAGRAAEKANTNPVISLAYLKLKISDRFRLSKKWHQDPSHHGTMEIPPPPPRKSCLDRARNSVARTAAQIRSGHWRSAVYLKRIRKGSDDECWFCKRSAKMTRSHVLLHCPSEGQSGSIGRNPGGVRPIPGGKGGLSVS